MNIHPVLQVSTPTPPLADAVLVSGRCLAAELHGKAPKERAYLGAQFVTGGLRLVWPTPAQMARLIEASPRLVHRAFGHPVRAPSRAQMLCYIDRFGVAHTEALIAQIRAVTVNGRAP
jgi:hypothetical protein